MGSELSAWLRKQAEADIAAARAATPGPWEFEGDDPTDDEVFDVPQCRPVAFTRGGARQVANGQHIARHDPLTEVARAESVLMVVSEYESAVGRYEAEQADYGAWVRSETAGERPKFPGPDRALIPGLEAAVRLLAYGHRFREGYKKEWMP